MATNSTFLKKGGPWARLAALTFSLPWIASAWATGPPVNPTYIFGIVPQQSATVLVRAALTQQGIAITPKFVTSHGSVYLSVAQSLCPAGKAVLEGIGFKGIAMAQDADYNDARESHIELPDLLGER